MELKIENKQELDAWLNERRKMGRPCFAIKGDAPEGATYSDGSPIERPINVAWRDGVSGEVFPIKRSMTPNAAFSRPPGVDG